MFFISLPLATISTNQSYRFIHSTDIEISSNQPESLFTNIDFSLHGHTATVQSVLLHTLTRQTLFAQLHEADALIDTEQEAISYHSI